MQKWLWPKFERVHVENEVYIPDGSSPAQSRSSWVLTDTEWWSVRFPNVLFVIIVFGCHYHTVSDKEWRVEPNTKLSNQIWHLVCGLGILQIQLQFTLTQTWCL